MIYEVFVDGGVWPNPGGETRICIVTRQKLREVESIEDRMENAHIEFCGSLFSANATNNNMEYVALLNALHWINESVDRLNDMVTIFSDSLMLVNQMNGIWRVKEGGYKPNYKFALMKLFEFELIPMAIGGRLKVCHVPREMNIAGLELDKWIRNYSMR